MVSVRKRGKVYEYRFETASVDGTRKWITKSGFRTKQEALNQGALDYNKYYRIGRVKRNKEMSYADYLDFWIDTYCNFNLKYSTIVTYLNIMKNYLKPMLGGYSLSQIDTQMLQEFINKIYVEKNLSKWYLKGIMKVIKGSLKYACYTVNYINENPAERVHIPRYEIVAGDPAHIFTQEEIERILDRFKNTPHIYYAFLTAYYTGMRTSEVFGLTWDCVDFENKTITINKNIIRKNKFGLPKRYKSTKGHSIEVWSYGTCKNPRSQRTISIGDTLVEALKEFKRLQEENRKYYGDNYLKHYEKRVISEYTQRPEIKIVDAKAELDIDLPEAKLVFVSPNGFFRGTESTRYAFKVINYELGIPCRFHDFRDTHATRLIEQGAYIKAVSKRLGHSTIMTTYNIYVRVTDKMETETVKTFEGYANTLDIPKTVDKPYLD